MRPFARPPVSTSARFTRYALQPVVEREHEHRRSFRARDDRVVRRGEDVRAAIELDVQLDAGAGRGRELIVDGCNDARGSRRVDHARDFGDLPAPLPPARPREPHGLSRTQQLAIACRDRRLDQRRTARDQVGERDAGADLCAGRNTALHDETPAIGAVIRNCPASRCAAAYVSRASCARSDDAVQSARETTPSR
jgi:hypothetical protein